MPSMILPWTTLLRFVWCDLVWSGLIAVMHLHQDGRPAIIVPPTVLSEKERSGHTVLSAREGSACRSRPSMISFGNELDRGRPGSPGCHEEAEARMVKVIVLT